MDKDKVKCEVKINAKDMFSFFLQHNYRSASGLFGVFLSLVALAFLVTGFNEIDDTAKVVLVMIFLLFIVIQPITLYSRAYKQVMLNPVYKKPLIYCFDEEGVTVIQDENEQKALWESVQKVKTTKKLLLIYTTRVNACIIPISQISDEYSLICGIIKNASNTKGVKIPNSMKRD